MIFTLAVHRKTARTNSSLLKLYLCGSFKSVGKTCIFTFHSLNLFLALSQRFVEKKPAFILFPFCLLPGSKEPQGNRPTVSSLTVGSSPFSRGQNTTVRKSEMFPIDQELSMKDSPAPDGTTVGLSCPTTGSTFPDYFLDFLLNGFGHWKNSILLQCSLDAHEEQSQFMICCSFQIENNQVLLHMCISNI